MKSLRNTAKNLSIVAVFALSALRLYSAEAPVTESYIDDLKAAAYKAGRKAQKVGAVLGITGDNLAWLGHKAVNLTSAGWGASAGATLGAIASGATVVAPLAAVVGTAAGVSPGKIGSFLASNFAGPVLVPAVIGAAAGWYLSEKALNLLSKVTNVLLEGDESEISKEQARKALADAQEMIADAQRVTDLSDASSTAD